LLFTAPQFTQFYVGAFLQKFYSNAVSNVGRRLSGTLTSVTGHSDESPDAETLGSPSAINRSGWTYWWCKAGASVGVVHGSERHFD